MNEVVSLFIYLPVCCDYLRKNRTNKDTRGSSSNELVQDREGSWVDSEMRVRRDEVDGTRLVPC